MAAIIWVTDRSLSTERLIIPFNIHSWQHVCQFKLIYLQQKVEDAYVFCGGLANKMTNKKHVIDTRDFACPFPQILVILPQALLLIPELLQGKEKKRGEIYYSEKYTIYLLTYKRWAKSNIQCSVFSLVRQLSLLSSLWICIN